MINVFQILKQCGVDQFVKRVKHTRELGDAVYLVAETRDAQWMYLTKAPDGFDVIFRETEAECVSWAPRVVRLGWT